MVRGVTRAFRVLGTGLARPDNWLVDWVRNVENDSGYPIDSVSAMRYAPVWYAVNKIAGHVGSIPLVLYRRAGKETREAPEHPAYRLANMEANEWMSDQTFRETMTADALLWGNGRAMIVRNGRGPESLIHLDPARCATVLIGDVETQTRQKVHVFTHKTGQPSPLFDYDVVHIMGLGSDGMQGYSLIEMAKNSWGMGLAAERSANRFFKNNAIPNLILEAPPGVFRDEAQAKEFLRTFNEYHGGSENAGKTGLLREGIKATPMTMSSRDAQFIEQRKFQRQEAALWMLLEQILGDDSSVSYNSLEMKTLAYLQNCLARWLVKWEKEFARKLLMPSEYQKKTHFFRFTVAAMLKATTVERWQVYEKALVLRVMSPNEVREKEDMNPREGGDEYANPNIDKQDPTTSKIVPSARLGYESGREVAHKMAVSRLRELIRVEVRRVRDASGRETNFLDWMDRFYQGFESRIAAAFSGLGASDELASEYVADSRRRLLVVADEATQAEFVEAIRTTTAEWQDRADEWADKIVEVEYA